jgi:hypothetical protein
MIAQRSDCTPDTTSDDTSGLSLAELDAIADDALGTDTPPRTLWALLTGSEAGRTSAYALCQRSGYTNLDPTSQWYIRAQDVSGVCKGVIGRMSSRGIARARAYQLRTGMSPDKVADTLSRCMDSDNDGVATRAADTASKVLGMQQAGTHVNVQVNTQINVRTVDPLVAACVEDDSE